MMTYWSSANGSTTGEVLGVTLATPTRLRGFRILAIAGTNDSVPSRLSVRSFDADDAPIGSNDVAVPADPMWKPMPLTIDTPVSRLELVITEVLPVNGNRVVVSTVELFGIP